MANGQRMPGSPGGQGYTNRDWGPRTNPYIAVWSFASSPPFPQCASSFFATLILFPLIMSFQVSVRPCSMGYLEQGCQLYLLFIAANPDYHRTSATPLTLSESSKYGITLRNLAVYRSSQFSLSTVLQPWLLLVTAVIQPYTGTLMK